MLALFASHPIQSQELLLESITVDDGLPQGLVLSPLQTHDGFLWFSTNAGLSRYDGIQFVEFLHDPFNPYSPAQNIHGKLYEDRRGHMWIKYGGKDKAVDIYDPESGRFYHTEFDLSKGNHTGNVFCEDPNGTLWYGNVFIDQDRIELNDTTPPNITVHYETIPIEHGHDSIHGLDLHLTKDSILYYLTFYGFYEIDWREKEIVEIDHFDDLKNGEAEHPIKRKMGACIFEDETGRIWVSMDKIYYLENGSLVPAPFPKEKKGNLFQLDGWIYSGIHQLNRFSPLKPKSTEWPIFTLTQKKAKKNFRFYRPFIDQSGIIWLGTNGHGVRILNPFKRKFKHYLSGHSIRSPFEGQGERLWKQHGSASFHQVDLSTGRKYNFIGENGFSVDLMQDENGNYWVAGGVSQKEHGRYLLRVDKETGAEKWFDSKTSLVGKSVHRSQRSILENGKIWLLGNDSLACFTIENEQFEYWDLSSLKIQSKQSKLSFHTFIKKGELEFWAGSPFGLFQLKLKNKKGRIKTRFFQTAPTQPNSLSLNHIYSLCLDPAKPEHFLWIGTNGNGLNKMNLNTGEFQHFTKADGLPNGVIYSIHPGTKNDLWMSTNFGLSNFNPATGLFTNFTVDDGLQSNEFNGAASFRAKNGTLYFGGVNGLNIFHPDSLRLNENVPKMAITALIVNNEKVDYRASILGKKKTIISSPINQVKAIDLTHFQNVIGIEYAALDFTAPSQNRYRHQLVGVDEDWVEAVHEHRVQYANLPPGKYLFKVIGSNNDGVWNSEPATLEINILPPWWKTKWAYGLYFLAALSGIFWLYNFQIKRDKEQNQLAFEKNEAERLAELDRTKTDFFSNVTHEFRTPLTLILEPVRQMLKEDIDDKFRQRLSLVKDNGEKMLVLVNQLLDMAKLEDGKMRLDLRQGNIMETIRPIFQSFLILAKNKGIKLKMNGSRKIDNFYFDPPKVEKVVRNLLSNAVKFTSDGEVTLMFKQLEGDMVNFKNLPYLRLTVSDTGNGIPSDVLPHIFDRFYQVDSSSTRADEGTGIGLALTKELVELMNGSIEVNSTLGQGTTFRVSLPMAKVEKSAIAPTYFKEEKQTSLAPSLSQKQDSENSFLDSSQPIILLIEDNAELRDFTKAMLEKQYQIIEASNGAEGIRKSTELIPDLVVTDLMMPEKDGFEVCNELKNTELTSHVPIILLTAKSAVESKIKGLKTGADAYLTKPFHTEELLVRIANLIALRKKLQEKFSKGNRHGGIKKNIAELPKTENLFLRKLTALVDKNLDNDKLSVSELASKVFMSRSQLFRKLKALTGQSPNEFIRNYRLDRAMELLKNKEGNVVQVSMMVGFGDEKYFSTRFKERFGVSPSEV